MMLQIRTLTGKRRLFFTVAFLLLLVSTLALFFLGNGFAYFAHNEQHPFWLNVFFINYTFMGNGLFVICLALVLMFRFKRKKEGMALLCGFFLSGIAVQLLKNINRLSHPTIFFEEGQRLFLANNISAVDSIGFISGHTTIAFMFATVLVLIIKNAKWQLPILAGALLLGYSRIYLAQNHLQEILIGAVIGIISGTTAVYFAYCLKSYQYYFKKFFGMHRNETMSAERNIQPA